MNERQRKRFEEWWATQGEASKFMSAEAFSRAVYEAACQDEADAAQGLVRALEGAQEWLNGWASAEPYLSEVEAALKAYKGDAK